FVPAPATEDGRDDTSSTGAELRVWEDIRAEEFHVAAVCESEEVAAGQARDLVRTRRELAQARREHQNAVSERASLQELSEDRLRQVEGERDEARTAIDRARDELIHLGQKITRGEQEKATLTGELARSAEALAAERNRTAGEEARVLAGKIRHGLQWRARRLARRLRNLGGSTAPGALRKARANPAHADRSGHARRSRTAQARPGARGPSRPTAANADSAGLPRRRRAPQRPHHLGEGMGPNSRLRAGRTRGQLRR